MKKMIICLSLLLVGCTSTLPKEDSAQNALSWPGVYQGTLPCADCSGIKTTVSLFNDNSFIIQSVYEKTGKNDDVITGKGMFEWDKKNTSIIHLSVSPDEKLNVFIGEGYLKFYDQESKPIESNLNYKLAQIKTFE